MLNAGLMTCIVLAVGLPTVGIDTVANATAPAERTLSPRHNEADWVVVEGVHGDILYESPVAVLEEEPAVCPSYTDMNHNQQHETTCEWVTNCWSGVGFGVCKYTFISNPPNNVWSCECTVSPE